MAPRRLVSSYRYILFYGLFAIGALISYAIVHKGSEHLLPVSEDIVRTTVHVFQNGNRVDFELQRMTIFPVNRSKTRPQNKDKFDLDTVTSKSQKRSSRQNQSRLTFEFDTVTRHPLKISHSSTATDIGPHLKYVLNHTCDYFGDLVTFEELKEEEEFFVEYRKQLEEEIQEMNGRGNKKVLDLGALEKRLLNSVAEPQDDGPLHPDWLALSRRAVEHVDCLAVLRDDDEEQYRAVNDYPPKQPQIGAADYIEITRDCENFPRRRGYIPKSMNEEENLFPIAFSILMFRDVERFERLLRAVYRPQNVYCVHVERKTDNRTYQAVQSIVGCLPNVFLTPIRYNVERGMLSVIQPELLCMKELWPYKKWKYFINLTGQEFPLKTNWEIVRILQAYSGSNDILGLVAEGTRFEGRTRFVYRRKMPRHERKEVPPHNITMMKGSVHIVVTRGFVDYILHDRRADDFLWWVRDTGTPDETFFPSLNHNPGLGVPGSSLCGDADEISSKPTFTRAKAFVNLMPCPGNKVAHDICIIGVHKAAQMMGRPEMFANKFHLDYEPAGYACLEQWHFNKTMQELSGTGPTFDTSIYKGIITKHCGN